MKEKPSPKQIAQYVEWLKQPEGDAHLQISLPLTGGKGAEAPSARIARDYVKSPSTTGLQRTKTALTASEALSRIRCLAIEGHSNRDIAELIGCDERFVKTIIVEPGRLNRRYE